VFPRNLQNVTAHFPLGLLIGVAGVSGGVKSSLIIGTLYKTLFQKLHKASEYPGLYESLEVLEYQDKVIDIYLPEAKSLGYGPVDSPLMCKEGDAKLVMEMALSKLKCTFCPTFKSLAMFATANALIEKHWRYS
jgi:hypothetical protein